MKARNTNTLLTAVNSCIETLDLVQVATVEVDKPKQTITISQVENPDVRVKISPYLTNSHEWVTCGIVTEDTQKIAATAVSHFVAAQVRKALYERIFGDKDDE